MNQGQILKDELKRIGTSPDDFAAQLKIGRGKVFIWFKMAEIPPHERQKITAKLGDIFKDENSSSINEKYLYQLERTVEDLRFTIEVLKGNWRPVNPGKGSA